MRKPISIKLLQREETNRRISLMMTTLLKKTKKVKKNQIYKLISCLLQLRMIMMNLFSFNPNSNRLDLLVNFHLRSKSPHSIEEALFSHKQKMFSLKLIEEKMFDLKCIEENFSWNCIEEKMICKLLK